MFAIVNGQAILHIGETGVIYDDLEELWLDALGVISVTGSWRDHIRSVLEKYDYEYYSDVNRCHALWLCYQMFYLKVQQLAIYETGIKLL